VKIKVMADYNSTGIWNVDDGGIMLEFDELEVSDALQARIRAWCRIYDESMFLHDDTWEGGSKVDTTVIDWINNESLYIGRELKISNPDDHVEVWIETHDEGKLSGILKVRVDDFIFYGQEAAHANISSVSMPI
jgi:hypothetical protein